MRAVPPAMGIMPDPAAGQGHVPGGISGANGLATPNDGGHGGVPPAPDAGAQQAEGVPGEAGQGANGRFALGALADAAAVVSDKPGAPPDQQKKRPREEEAIPGEDHAGSDLLRLLAAPRGGGCARAAPRRPRSLHRRCNGALAVYGARPASDRARLARIFVLATKTPSPRPREGSGPPGP